MWDADNARIIVIQVFYPGFSRFVKKKRAMIKLQEMLRKATPMIGSLGANISEPIN